MIQSSIPITLPYSSILFLLPYSSNPDIILDQLRILLLLLVPLVPLLVEFLDLSLCGYLFISKMKQELPFRQHQ